MFSLKILTILRVLFGCGLLPQSALSSKNNVARIVGGTSTTIAQVPYLVSLRVSDSFFCGGTLVARNFVVTAAHCVKGVSTKGLTVVGGAARLSSGGVSRTVIKIMIPKIYKASTLHMDVAVLKLSGPLSGKNIKPIGLCNKNLKTGNLLKVSGWGLIHEYSSREPDNVQTINVPLISMSSCKQIYGAYGWLTSTMFCAAVLGKKDFCSGDSGGPAVYNNRVCGIVSWSVGCARHAFPGVYTDVRSVKSFIRNSLKK